MDYGPIIGGTAGTIAGSFFGPIGSTVGGALGSGLGAGYDALRNKSKSSNGSRGNFFTGSQGGFEQISPYSDWQQQYMQQNAQQAMQGLQNPYAGFDPIRQQALNQFQNELVPSLAERFTSMGDNRVSSPAFASQLGSASSDFATGLAALQAQYGLQNRSLYQNQLAQSLSPLYQNYNVPSQQGFFGELLSKVAPVAGKIGAQATGAYLGAKPGEGSQAFKSAVINGLKGVA